MDVPQIDIKQLNDAQKLDLLEEIWESLTKTPAAIPLSPAQRAELDRRLDDLEQTGPTGVPWEEVAMFFRKRF